MNWRNTSHDKSAEKNSKHVCRKCGKQFMAQDYLTAHMMKKHNGGLYTCNKSEKGFMTLPNLTTQMKTCNGGLYTYNKCGEGFMTLSNLTKHMKTCN